MDFMQRLAAVVPRSLNRVFDINIEQRSQCRSSLKTIAAIGEPLLIERSLTFLYTVRGIG